jgi:hypothetical protein
MLRDAGPDDIRTIALCTEDDELLRPLAWRVGI